MPETPPEARCPLCDRAECESFGPPTLTYGNGFVGRKPAECDGEQVDWRARCLEAEARLAAPATDEGRRQRALAVAEAWQARVISMGYGSPLQPHLYASERAVLADVFVAFASSEVADAEADLADAQSAAVDTARRWGAAELRSKALEAERDEARAVLRDIRKRMVVCPLCGWVLCPYNCQLATAIGGTK